MKRAIGILSVGLFLIAATPTTFGGWAVVTFDDVPEYLVAGQPTSLTFKIRQHGQTLLNDRSPSLTLRDSNGGLLSRMIKRNRVDAVRAAEDGAYTTTITPDHEGHVTIVVNTDVHGWKTRLLPIPVLGPGDHPKALSLEDRGRQLFGAKGCATCHMKSDDKAFEDWRIIRVGPELTGRSYPDEWLAEKIRNPGQYPTLGSIDQMPDLNVSDAQITALVRYINGGQSQTVTQTRGTD